MSQEQGRPSITLGPSPKGAFLTYVGAYHLIRGHAQRGDYKQAYQFAIECFPDLPAWGIRELVNGDATISQPLGTVTMEWK